MNSERIRDKKWICYTGLEIVPKLTKGKASCLSIGWSEGEMRVTVDQFISLRETGGQDSFQEYIDLKALY